MLHNTKNMSILQQISEVEVCGYISTLSLLMVTDKYILVFNYEFCEYS